MVLSSVRCSLVLLLAISAGFFSTPASQAREGVSLGQTEALIAASYLDRTHLFYGNRLGQTFTTGPDDRSLVRLKFMTYGASAPGSAEIRLWKWLGDPESTTQSVALFSAVLDIDELGDTLHELTPFVAVETDTIYYFEIERDSVIALLGGYDELYAPGHVWVDGQQPVYGDAWFEAWTLTDLGPQNFRGRSMPRDRYPRLRSPSALGHTPY